MALKHKLPNSTRLWLVAFAVLFVETQAILVPNNWTIRTELRAWLHLPIYHIFLTFTCFAVLFRVSRGKHLAPMPELQLSQGFAVLHVGWALSLILGLKPLWRLIQAWPIEARGVLFLALMGGLVTSWFAVLVPVRVWREQLRAHLPWLVPCAILALSTRLVSMGSNLLWTFMPGLTFQITLGVLSLFFDELVADEERRILGTRDFYVEIEPGCSGYEGMGLIALFTIVYLYLKRKELSFPAAYSLIPAGMLINFVGNSLRLVVLVLIGNSIDPVLARNGFHSQAGWISFATVALLMLYLTEKRGWFARTPSELAEPEAPVEPEISYPAASWLAPLLVLLLAKLVSAAFTLDFDIWYPLRILVILICIGGFRSHYHWQRPQWWSVAVGVVTYVVWVSLIPGKPDKTVFEAMSPPLTYLWLFFRIFGSSVVIPFVEELAFRGYLLRRLQSSYFDEVPIGRFTLVSVLCSSLVFGVLHGDWVAGTLAGLAYAACCRGGNLWNAIVAHGVTNFLICVQVLALGHWSLWS